MGVVSYWWPSQSWILTGLGPWTRKSRHLSQKAPPKWWARQLSYFAFGTQQLFVLRQAFNQGEGRELACSSQLPHLVAQFTVVYGVAICFAKNLIFFGNDILLTVPQIGNQCPHCIGAMSVQYSTGFLYPWEYVRSSSQNVDCLAPSKFWFTPCIRSPRSVSLAEDAVA